MVEQIQLAGAVQQHSRAALHGRARRCRLRETVRPACARRRSRHWRLVPAHRSCRDQHSCTATCKTYREGSGTVDPGTSPCRPRPRAQLFVLVVPGTGRQWVRCSVMGSWDERIRHPHRGLSELAERSCGRTLDCLAHPLSTLSTAAQQDPHGGPGLRGWAAE